MMVTGFNVVLPLQFLIIFYFSGKCKLYISVKQYNNRKTYPCFITQNFNIITAHMVE